MATREEAKKYAAQNRRARFDFFIDDVLEAGIMLTGSEVKSLRGGRASVNEAYAGLKDGELYLFNAYIPEYLQAGRRQSYPLRHVSQAANLYIGYAGKAGGYLKSAVQPSHCALACLAELNSGKGYRFPGFSVCNAPGTLLCRQGQGH